MAGITCFFVGHREAGENLQEPLAQAVEQHIAMYGVTNFVVGQYGGFDRLAAWAVKKSKRQHPGMGIRLTLLLPYHPAERPIDTPPGFDGTFYPPMMETVPRRVAIVRANQYMVDNSDFLIAYAWHPGSNARNLLNYAKKREERGLIHIENLADEVKNPT